MLEHFLPGAQEPMLKGYTVVAQATMRDDTREEKKERKKIATKGPFFFFWLSQMKPGVKLVVHREEPLAIPLRPQQPAKPSPHSPL